MSYLVSHHGALYFQIRVPAVLHGRFGRLVRIHLQTSDVAIAKALAIRLAGERLMRFATEREWTDESVAAGHSGSEPLPGGPCADDGRSTGSSTPTPIAPTLKAGKPARSPAESPKPLASTSSDHEILALWFRSDPTRVRSTVSDFRAARARRWLFAGAVRSPVRRKRRAQRTVM